MSAELCNFQISHFRVVKSVSFGHKASVVLAQFIFPWAIPSIWEDSLFCLLPIMARDPSISTVGCGLYLTNSRYVTALNPLISIGLFTHRTKFRSKHLRFVLQAGSRTDRRLSNVLVHQESNDVFSLLVTGVFPCTYSNQSYFCLSNVLYGIHTMHPLMEQVLDLTLNCTLIAQLDCWENVMLDLSRMSVLLVSAYCFHLKKLNAISCQSNFLGVKCCSQDSLLQRL